MIFLTKNVLSNMTVGELGIYIALFVAVLKGVWEFGQWGWKRLMIWHNGKNMEDEKDDTIEYHTKQITEMDTRHKEDYQQINGKIDALTVTLDVFIQETKKDNQVILRDKIYDLYKITLKNGYLIEKDSKNYHYALARYKANEGNSYILDEVVPKMKEFKVFLCKEDADEYLKK